MKVKELAERLNAQIPTGRLIAYIKDGLVELNTLSETHVTTERINIKKDQRFYELPHDYIKITDVRAKNQNNTKDEYRSIPRGIGKLINKDADDS
tara:strand:- start:1148 stop:1432 length:285 start_codon:yes stop_codon:yes gene_type:complete